jgi:ADP-ribosylglycohydrolase
VLWYLPEFAGTEWIWAVLFLSAASTIPAAVGIAIMRYRLYEIDLLINRTLVYGALTATLALVYFGGIATTEAIFRALTGQEQQPQLAIVVSTLVIAALFNPLRRRIQSFIDRRFYRRKYDARKTLEAFSAKLRDETDLEALSDDLVGVVKETMQPVHVSLWLRPDTASRRGQANQQPTLLAEGRGR